MTRERVFHGRAYRNGTVVCDRVQVTVIESDERLGLAPWERQYVTVRFLRGIQPEFRRQLVQVLRRRGARSRRVADALDPIELEVQGTRRLAARIEPPIARHASLEQTAFRLGQHPG
jgi:hypothetical protein